MNINDVLQIGPYKYNVIKRDGNRALVQWVESTGIERTMWLLIKKTAIKLNKGAYE
jgi:hypothetical protein